MLSQKKTFDYSNLCRPSFYTLKNRSNSKPAHSKSMLNPRSIDRSKLLLIEKINKKLSMDYPCNSVKRNNLALLTSESKIMSNMKSFEKSNQKLSNMNSFEKSNQKITKFSKTK